MIRGASEDGGVRRQATFPGMLRLPAPTAEESRRSLSAALPFPRKVGERGQLLASRAIAGGALILLLVTMALLVLRSAHADRVYPAVVVADVAVGGLSASEAATALRVRAEAIESSIVSLSYDGRLWQAPLREIGLDVDVESGLASALGVGREPAAWDRLRAVAGLVRDDERITLPMRLDSAALSRWFDSVDRELGSPPRNASLAIEGTAVEVVPEIAGVVVDRPRATAEIETRLARLEPVAAVLPTLDRPPAVRAADLDGARDQLRAALAVPVQVTQGGGVWTLPAADLGRFVTQSIDPGKQGAAAFSLGMDRTALTAWLDERLASEINREKSDAEVGWDGERLVSLTPSVDGTTLRAADLAGLVQQSFFGGHGAVVAPVDIDKPVIDSNNLDALGVTTLLARGTSNYSGSEDGRATNVEVGAALLNGTLIPPRSEFSFNNAVGYISEDKGFVEAQVILGEAIGKDIGGGICQVSTTAFRAAYFAGLPMTEWWPHRFRIPFYEYDGWDPGLDASILQPTEDPSTWADFRFENPSDQWMLVESWTDGVNVVVNLYGADLGYRVETTGPRLGERFQVAPDQEQVDPELEPGTIDQVQVAAIGEEVSHYRRVYDRGGELLWERNFYTKFFPKGNVWAVSQDMKGKSPADPHRDLPPLPKEPSPAGESGTEASAEPPTEA